MDHVLTLERPSIAARAHGTGNGTGNGLDNGADTPGHGTAVNVALAIVQQAPLGPGANDKPPGGVDAPEGRTPVRQTTPKPNVSLRDTWRDIKLAAGIAAPAQPPASTKRKSETEVRI